jgi:perosamine synthetase
MSFLESILREQTLCRNEKVKLMKRIIKIAKPTFGDEEIEAVSDVLRSGNLVQGEKVGLFEEKFAKYIGVKHAVVVANGTIALDLALKTLKIHEGDEVITPVFSFIASSNCILYQAAEPIFSDIDSKTFNINPNYVTKNITKKTKAVIIVHLYGQTADMDKFEEIAEEHGIMLIEDASQAHGAEYEGRKAGSMTKIGCFSFYPTKNMTTGEGGAITTNDDKIANEIRLLRDHGQKGKYDHVILGYNYRMTEMAAAIGLVQLAKLDKLNGIRMKNATLLTKHIQGVSGLTPPHVNREGKHVFCQYVIKVEKNYPMKRDALAEYLRKKGIETAVHYPKPISKQSLYMDLGYGKKIFPNAEEASERVLSLPVHPLVTKEDIESIADALKEIK